jgi:large conductance mechanosensitive channel
LALGGVISLGEFFRTNIHLVTIAIVIFLSIKGMNSFKKREIAAPVKPSPKPEKVICLAFFMSAQG